VGWGRYCQADESVEGFECNHLFSKVTAKANWISVSTDSNQFENLAAKQASSEGVRRLFELLATRATTLQTLHIELQKVIVTNRELRSRKTFSFSRRQKRLLSEFQKDAEDATRELPAGIERLSDAALLSVALRNERQQLETEGKLYAVFRDEDKPATEKILAFRQETIRIITGFIENSEFRDTFSARARR
jgi:hypothetical protein